jgi:hypothetical protein
VVPHILVSLFHWISLAFTGLRSNSGTLFRYPERVRTKSVTLDRKKKMKIKGLYQKRGWYYYRPAQKGGVRPPAVALGTKDEEAAIAKVYKMHTEGGLERNVVGSNRTS